jgi:hypothetical protein
MLWLAWFVAFVLLYTIAIRLEGLTQQVESPRGAVANAGPQISLGQAVLAFYQFPYTWALTVATVGFWVAKLWVGDWRWLQFVFSVGMLAAWPIVEWIVHHYVLHAQSLRIFGWTLDVQSPAHILHHRNPWHPRYTLGPSSSLVFFCVGVPLMWHLIFPPRGALLTTAMTLTLVLNYEWTHFLIHTSYRPRTWLYRRLWVNHRLHHFKNEDYWYGVTMLSGDKLLGTSPGSREVPHSPTVITLGVEKDIDRWTALP